MNDALLKEIDELKITLDSLPKNNKKNKEKYLEILGDNINIYKKLNNKVHDEIVRRSNLINEKVAEKNDLSSQQDKLNTIINQLSIFREYNTSYEKLSLDKTFYNFYEDKNKYFESIINNIDNLIKEYQQVGIVFTEKTFKYSPVVYNYMKIYFKQNKKDIEELKTSFEKIYWEVANFIIHIELTFKNMYYNNIKSFDKYIETKKINIMNQYSDDIINVYKKEKKEYDRLYFQDIGLIVEDFLSNKRMIDDYSDDKVNSLLSDYIDNCSIGDEKYNNSIDIFEKFYRTMREYRNYLKYLKMIENMKELYKEKDSYKGAFKNKRNEIVKEEKKLLKLSNKVYKLARKEKDTEEFDIKIDEEMNIIKTLYDELEEVKFKESIYKLTNNDEVIDLLKIANSYYAYQSEYYKKEDESISLKDIDNNINELLKFIINPYNNLINNINITEEVDVKETISNVYNLSEIKITKDILEDSNNIDKIIEDLEKILINYHINNSNITVEDIKYLCNIKGMKL